MDQSYNNKLFFNINRFKTSFSYYKKFLNLFKNIKICYIKIK